MAQRLAACARYYRERRVVRWAAGDDLRDGWVWGLGQRSSPESLLDLKRCNLANLTTEFTKEEDRLIAIYGAINLLSKGQGREIDKTPSLENAFVTKKVSQSLSAFSLSRSIQRLVLILSPRHSDP